MAITGIGLGGSQAAYGTFTAKAPESAPQAAYVAVFSQAVGSSVYARVL